ncbi:FtsQ-type POTRA domain-containing protein [Paenalkalicoccus suaedae]|uniref:Cell division protein DivIB n=1 Tax=Paenalkalicoccus suaedae TaxID=2592382 RepID=A0A859FEY8_9BACI|nr:FtsQ-type POTRA domain-containing protein [Paenalkalicoccus suaedae]QKS71521.1 FtsQ-type POTRA domain-containing protein [Paenalkalicoccus suaedae]
MAKRKVVDIENRIPQLKEQRRRRTNRRLISYIIVFFLLIACIVYLQSPLSNVQSVSVDGNTEATSESVIEASGLLNDVNMWNLDQEAREGRIEANPAISSATISRTGLTSTSITIEEHAIVAFMYENDEYIPLLDTGERLDRIESTPAEAPIMRDFSSDSLQRELVTELSKLSTQVSERISDIRHTPVENDSGRITLFMTDGFTVSSTVRNFASRMATYPAVVSQLDASVEGVVHMRMNPYFEPANALEEGELEEGEEVGES